MKSLEEFCMNRKEEIMSVPPVMRMIGLAATIGSVALYIKIIRDISHIIISLF